MTNANQGLRLRQQCIVAATFGAVSVDVKRRTRLPADLEILLISGRNHRPPLHPHVADPHDHLFQLVFADPIHAVPLLRSALPAAIARLIDWSTLTRKKATQRGRRGRKTLCDV
ncbi:MAG: Rpn family recombination-promoting nuclease/putative transposase, partial [Planctomycetes bacterium]|nr:Rpn family recombination-promoting nuclease/putative transposase [Planctomycetota bacterium]